MKKEFEGVKYMCGTADIWSTKRKSFMGVTVHWVDEESLKRMSKVLCCRRFLSPHDNERIAILLNAIYNDFSISDKILCTVTDNASNFVKAFKDFGVTFEAFLSFMASKDDQNENGETNEHLNVGTHEDDSYSNESESADSHLDENDNLNEQEQFVEFVELMDGVLLSAHFRCGSHTFCRIAVKDASNAMRNSTYAAQHKSVFCKINSLYKRTKRPKSSEIIHDILKMALILPAKTRWNSLFDSIEHILRFELKILNTLMLALDLSQFTQTDYDFLKEYVRVMEPIATAVDNLQSTNSYYAIFLPTLHSVKYVLDDLGDEMLIYCSPLLECVKEGFHDRFGQFFDLENEQCVAATIAAVTHPHFKTRWLHEEYQQRWYIDQLREELISKAMNESPTVDVTPNDTKADSTVKPKGNWIFYESQCMP